MKPENAIEVHDITKSFKVYMDKGNTLKELTLFKKRRKYEIREVLKGISFEVKRGEAVGLIGHNGCGKSTTLKMLTKIMYPDSGTIEMRGRVSSLIELGAGFHPDMSGRDNIYTNASIFGLTKREIDERVDDIIEFSELEEFIDNPVRTYSSGMYMRLAFSVAINVDADILLIDEILAVGDAGFQAKCFNKLKEIKAKGTTIVIVSHSLGQIEQICDQTIWINDGVIAEEGLPRIVHPKYMEYMGLGEKNEETITDFDWSYYGENVSKINDIIYLPSNCRQSENVKDEMDASLVWENIHNSLFVDTKIIQILGEEPFSNKSLINFLKQGLEQSKYSFWITSKGYYADRIKKVVENVNEECQRRLCFRILVDDSKEQDTQKALETVKMLAETKANIDVYIEARLDNITVLNDLSKTFRNISDRIRVNYMPMIVDASESTGNYYTKEYKERVYSFLANPVSKKLVLSDGKYGITQCHAGEKNICIGADGRVFTCVPGAYDKGNKADFCIGDLKQNTLDEIWIGRSNVISAVQHCKGCSHLCEIDREVRMFGQSIRLTSEQAEKADALEKERRLGDALLDLEGWHCIEYLPNNKKQVWSSKNNATIFIDNKEEDVEIKLVKFFIEDKIKIFVDGTEVDGEVEPSGETNEYLVRLSKEFFAKGRTMHSIEFACTSLHIPADETSGEDKRALGVRLKEVVRKTRNLEERDV